MPAQLAAPADKGVSRNSAHKITAPLFKPASVKPNPTPVAPALDTLPISAPQCEKALTALLAHVAKVQLEREEKDLLGEQEEKVFLVVGMKKAAKREVHKPVRLYVLLPFLTEPQLNRTHTVPSPIPSSTPALPPSPSSSRTLDRKSVV